MGREREALRPPQGLVEADGRPQVRPLRGNDPLPRPEMHVRAGDTRHLPQCLQEDDGAGQGCARAARPHGEGLPGPRPGHEARGRHNLSQDHGRLHLPGRGHRPVRAHGRRLEHAGQHEGRPRGRSPRDGPFARPCRRRGHIPQRPRKPARERRARRLGGSARREALRGPHRQPPRQCGRGVVLRDAQERVVPPRAPVGCIHGEARGDRVHRVVLQPLPPARAHRGPRAGRGHAGVLRPLRECPPGRSGSHAGRMEICDSAVHYIDRAQTSLPRCPTSCG